jgi:hypothetical protein
MRGQVHGFVTAFGWGAAMLGAAALVVLLFIKAGRLETQAGGPAHLG